MKFSDILTKINECALDDTFSELYGEDTDILKKQKERYIHALEMFSSTFPEDPDRDISIFSSICSMLIPVMYLSIRTAISLG